MSLPEIQKFFHSSWNTKVSLEGPFLEAFARRIGSMLARAIESRYNKTVVVDVLSPAFRPVCVLSSPSGENPNLPSGLLKDPELNRFTRDNPENPRPIPLRTFFKAVEGGGNLHWKGSRILEIYEIAQRTLAL